MPLTSDETPKTTNPPTEEEAEVGDTSKTEAGTGETGEEATGATAEDDGPEATDVTPEPLPEQPGDILGRLVDSRFDTEGLPTAELRGDTRNTRISGDNRYETSVAIADHGFPETAATVVVASGENYPDSLSAAPVAAKLNAPLLLTAQTSLSHEVQNKIKNLQPSRIIIAGGTASVGASVEATLKTLVKAGGTVERAAGANRYSTSVALAKKGWPTNGSTKIAFIATGTNFADALAAGPAAKQRNAPVLLVPGPLTNAPTETLAELNRHGINHLYIAGGTASVSNPMVVSLQSHTRGLSVAQTRHAGAGRFETAALIATSHFPSSVPSSYWASGYSFADALSGSAVAGKNNAPLLLTQLNCVPTTTYDANDSRRPLSTYLLGGKASLADSVLRGDECMSAAPGMTAQDLAGSNQIYGQINQARYNANRQGARLADKVTNCYTANEWSFNMIKKNQLSNDPALATKAPWVAWEYVLKDPTRDHANPQVAFDYLKSQSYNYSKIVLYNDKPTGVRMLVSVSWLHRGSTGWLTIHTGD